MTNTQAGWSACDYTFPGDRPCMLEDWEGRTESGVGAPHLSGTQRCECVIGEDHAFDAPEPDELEVRR
jgi:hypothetical protein